MIFQITFYGTQEDPQPGGGRPNVAIPLPSEIDSKAGPEITTFRPSTTETPDLIEDVEVFNPEGPAPPPLNLSVEEVLESKVDEIFKDIEKLEIDQESVEDEVLKVVEATSSSEEAKIDDVAASLIILSQQQK